MKRPMLYNPLRYNPLQNTDSSKSLHTVLAFPAQSSAPAPLGILRRMRIANHLQKFIFHLSCM